MNVQLDRVSEENAELRCELENEKKSLVAMQEGFDQMLEDRVKKIKGR